METTETGYGPIDPASGRLVDSYGRTRGVEIAQNAIFAQHETMVRAFKPGEVPDWWTICTLDVALALAKTAARTAREQTDLKRRRARARSAARSACLAERRQAWGADDVIDVD